VSFKLHAKLNMVSSNNNNNNNFLRISLTLCIKDKTIKNVDTILA